MINLKTDISSKRGNGLTGGIRKFIQQKPRIISPGLNRRAVLLTKYVEASKNRRNRTLRRQRFFCGVELLRKATKSDLICTRETQSGMSYEFKGTTPSGEEITIHIREEIKGKDKLLYLISTF